MGFVDLFDALYAAERIRTGFLDGSLSAMRFFTEDVLPLVLALRNGDKFATAAIVRKRSPLLTPATLKAADEEQPQRLKHAREAVSKLGKLWEGSEPTLADVVRVVSQTGLFEVPDVLLIAAEDNEDIAPSDQPGIESTDNEGRDEVISAWAEALRAQFKQIELYAAYVSGEAPFDTHQGVKGREFPRVMVIIDDQEARGFMFSYDRLFGAVSPSASRRSGSPTSETSEERTRRLFYVTCSRAMASLAIVAYSANPGGARDHVIQEGWFAPEEVEVIS
jgi:DNA helicase-2/ATP-dependent DNA helicase PcrA